jgi:hypothetical protein
LVHAHTTSQLALKYLGTSIQPIFIQPALPAIRSKWLTGIPEEWRCCGAERLDDYDIPQLGVEVEGEARGNGRVVANVDAVDIEEGEISCGRVHKVSGEDAAGSELFKHAAEVSTVGVVDQWWRDGPGSNGSGGGQEKDEEAE